MSQPSAPTPPRLRVERVEATSSPDGYARVRVTLEWQERPYVGEAQGVLTREGDLRTGADATLEAIAAATGGRLRLGLVGIKAVRAFDSWVVISSVEARSDERHYKLLGARATDSDDMVRGAVLSVLDALNRVVELYVN